jgi:geranylgeranyl reductase
MKYKVAVVGGGPSGACAAEIFAQEKGIDTVLIERKLDNAKPCGGAIPLCMVGEFDLPESVVDRKVRYASVVYDACTVFSLSETSEHTCRARDCLALNQCRSSVRLRS